MISKDRQRKIYEYVQLNKAASIQELSDLIKVSISTIRRDLDELHEQGFLERTHGGAVLDHTFEPPITQRASSEEDYKRAIGREAAQLVNDGETILISSGTTTECMIPHIVSRRNLTVVTNSVRIAYVLHRYPQIVVVVLGGWLRHSEYSLLGHLTTQALADYRPDKIFHGIYSLNAGVGLLGTYPPEVQTDRALFSAAREVIILADHSKFFKNGSVKLASIEDIHTLITDEKAPQDQLESIAARNVRVIQARLP